MELLHFIKKTKTYAVYSPAVFLQLVGNCSI